MRPSVFTQFVVWIALLWAPVRAHAGTGIDPAVREAVKRDGGARVCVTLEAAPSGVVPIDAGRGEAPRDSGTGLPPLEARRQAFRAALDAALPALAGKGLDLRHRFTWSPVAVVDVTGEEGLESLSALPGLQAASLDSMGTGALIESRAAMRVDQAFEAGATGAGRVVAILDSGVEATHPDLEGSVIHEYHSLDRGDDVGPGALDGHGHGTHIAGIIASKGAVAPRGIAPGTKIVAVKVLDDYNAGFIIDWTRGLEHVIDLHETGTLRIDAVNMSFTTFLDFPGNCEETYTAFAGACFAARELGIALFAASGNWGSTTDMTAPACFSSVFSVASVLDRSPYEISLFSSRNIDTDLLAPGETITSSWMLGGVFSVAGTSPAVPHAAALACLLREKEPTLTPAEILRVLQMTGVPVHDVETDLTLPRIDAFSAISAFTDCNSNGAWDWRDIDGGSSGDCNENRLPDECDISSGASRDSNADGVPDECGPTFHRGDANSSGDIDLSDAVFIFMYLFGGGEKPACLEAADSNNDADVDISDGITLLGFLFLGGSAPPPPGPPGGPCGPDPDVPGSAGDLGCALYERC
jgi:subtilisin family serine protease